MQTPRQCAECGAPLPKDAPGALCPSCGFGAALKVDPKAPGDFHPSALFDLPLPTKVRYFGDYELLEEIARGGMGVVFRARQTSLNRTVAVKMILAGQLASAADVQRFRAEAEAAATLQHPNIVAIHEVGKHDGRHYFSMDYVEGHSLAELVREGALAAAQAAGLIGTIAEAIHYAHQRGVLHRDLKPSNVLIDAAGRPRITDFGLAKRIGTTEMERLTCAENVSGKVGVRASESLEVDPASSDSATAKEKQVPNASPASELTLTGQVLGSPNFMPPEQAAGKRGQLGPYSDVYSLGAILYYLLSARPPFMAETLVETLQRVQNSDPISPRLLNPGVPRDLETICLKCLEKEPRHRYGTARELADELGRFLRHEPILARRIGQVARLQRWGRRKPASAAALALGCILVLVLGIGSPIAVFRINRERQRAEQSSKNEAHQRHLAEQNAAKSRQVVQFLEDMLEGVGPSVALGRDTQMLREILDQTAERVGKELKDQPVVEADLRNILGVVYLELGDYQKAEAMHRKALEIRKELFGLEHKDVAESLGNLGTVLASEGKSAEGEALCSQALAIWRKVVGNENRDVADALNNLGEMLADQGKYTEAAAVHREALDLRRKLLGNESQAVAESLNNLAEALLFQGQYAEAEAMHREALALKRRLWGNDRPDVAKSLNNIASALINQGKLAEAEPLLRDALSLNRKLLPQKHPDLANSIDNLAAVLDMQGKSEETEALFREALAMRRELLGEVHPDVSVSLANLAEWLSKQARYAEAEALANQALTVSQKVRDGEHPDVASRLHTLANVLTRAGRDAEAEERYRDALAMWQKLLGDEHAQVAMALYNLGLVLTKRNKLAEAEAVYQAALTIAHKRFANMPSRLAKYIEGLANNLCSQRKYAQADQLFDEFVPPSTEIQRQGVALLRARATFRARRGRFAEAAADFTRAIGFNPEDADAWHLMAALLVQSGQLDAYREHCCKSLERFGKTTDPLVATRMAKDCTIMSESGVEAGAARAWADTSLKAGTNPPAWPALMSTKGVAEYRLGQFESAAQWMEKTLACPPESRAAWCEVETYAVLAMARFQLKQMDEARNALAKGIEVAETKLPKLESNDLGAGWVDWIIGHALVREAKAMIEERMDEPH